MFLVAHGDRGNVSRQRTTVNATSKESALSTGTIVVNIRTKCGLGQGFDRLSFASEQTTKVQQEIWGSFLGYLCFHHNHPVGSVLRDLELGTVTVRRKDLVRRLLPDFLPVVLFRTRPNPGVTV